MVYELVDYVNVLKILANQEPMRLKYIVSKAKVDARIIRDYLAVLIESKLVKKQFLARNYTAYVITKRGTNLLEFFHEIPQTRILRNPKS